MKLRLGVAAGVAVLGLVAVSVATVLGAFTAGGPRPAEDAALVQKVSALQEELRKKELALAVQENRLRELQEDQSGPGGVKRPGPTGQVSQQGPLASARPGAEDDGPLTALPAAPQKAETAVGPVAAEDDDQPGAAVSPLESAPQLAPAVERSRTGEPSVGAEKGPVGPIVSFNAREVTALAKGTNTGTLSFRLVKDRPEVKFSGYLFVFVEMEDKRGENRIYAYPTQTRLSEGDLPADYREGEKIEFKFNSRVEFDYGDTRPGTNLARVSILLYGDNGKIVFQRGFDRKEVKMVRAGENKLDRARSKAGDKRRAL